MTLEHWENLTPDERNANRRTWAWGTKKSLPSLDEWRNLARLAASRFREEYVSHPQINTVYFTNDENGFSIEVVTSLWPGEIAEDLPARYCGFSVVQKPVEASKHYYLTMWRVVLGNLLGWDGDRVLAWAKSMWWEELNHKGNSFFWHDPPEKYVAPVVVQELLAPEGREKQGDLLKPLEEAIRVDPLVDWYNMLNLYELRETPSRFNRQRARVEAVLRPYEVSLPDALPFLP
jgi:hypothetical protein